MSDKQNLTVIPFGPQHPVLPEPIQLQFYVDEERIVDVIPNIGYVHRGIERAIELNDYRRNLYLCERICGICNIIHGQTYAGLIEKMTDTEVPIRAKYLRTMWAEVARLQSHLLWLGLFAEAIGFESLFMKVWRDREIVLELTEATNGHRIHMGTTAIGGVIKDYFSLQTSFICMGLLALIGFLLSLFLLPPTGSERSLETRQTSFSWKALLYDRHLAGLLVFRFAYVVCVGIIWGFIPLFADTEFHASSSLIGILIMLGIFISGLIHIPMGYIADRTNKKLMVVAGGLIVSYAILSFEWAGAVRDLVVASIFFGLGGGIAMPALMAMAVLKGSNTNAMGSVMALMTVAHSLGMMCGALLGGMMMDFFKLRWAFPLGAAVMMVCIGFFLLGTYSQKAAAR